MWIVHAEMAVKRASEKPKSGKVFGQRGKKPEMFRVGLYARVSTQDQQTIPLQMRAMREYAATRGWTIVMQVRSERELRQKLMEAARRREIDIVLVWRLDRWGRSLPDLVSTLEELNHLGVGFVSLTEALDLTTPTGRAMAGLLSVFAQFEHEILRERVRAGLAHARENGKRLGRPATAAAKSSEIRKLHRAGVSKARSHGGSTSDAPLCAAFWVQRDEEALQRSRPREPDPEEAIVDAYGPEEKAMSWYYYLEGKLSFPFRAKCTASKIPLQKGEEIDVLSMAPDAACVTDMLVLVRWQRRKLAGPLAQLTAIDADDSTAEAIGDWH